MKKLSDYIGSFSYGAIGYSDTLEQNVNITTPTEALDHLLDLTNIRTTTLLDNQDNYIVVGDLADDVTLQLQYVMTDGVIEQVGTVRFVYDSVTANIDHEQTGNPELFDNETTFSADINVNEIRLAINLNSVGSNLDFRYKIDAIKKLI